MDIQQLLDDMLAMLAQFKESLIQFTPLLIGAVIYFVLGYLIARLIRKTLYRALLNVDRLVPRPSVRQYVKRYVQEKRIATIFSEIVYWTVIIIALAISTDTLGMPVVSEWLSDLTGYVPKILATVVIMTIGIILSLIIRDVVLTAANSAGIQQSTLISRLVQISIILIAVLLGVGHLGVDVSLLTGLITLTAGAVFLSGALAFGLGAGASVSNILAAHYLKGLFTIGQMIAINGHKGRIIQMTPTAVILESADGRAVIPARLFNEQTAIVLTEETSDE